MHFPADVRRMLYTINAIEALNTKRRSAVRTRGHFPTNEAALKLLYLDLEQDRAGVEDATPRVGDSQSSVRRPVRPALYQSSGITGSFNRPVEHGIP